MRLQMISYIGLDYPATVAFNNNHQDYDQLFDYIKSHQTGLSSHGPIVNEITPVYHTIEVDEDEYQELLRQYTERRLSLILRVLPDMFE